MIPFITVSVLLILLFVIQRLTLLVRLAVGEFLCQKTSLDGLQSNTNSSEDVNFNRLFDIVFIPVGFLHIPEHIYLLVYLYQFLAFYKGWDRKYKQAIQLKMRDFVCAKRGRSFCYIFILALFMLVAIAIPPVCVLKVYSNQNIDKKIQCSEQLELVTRLLTHIYHVTSFVTNGVVVLVRCLMVFFTIMVGVMWRRVRPPLPRSEEDPNQPAAVPGNQPAAAHPDGGDQPAAAHPDGGNQPAAAHSDGENHPANPASMALDMYPFQKDIKEIFDRHSKYLMEFKDIKEKVVHVYKIFGSFFVLQWIIHLFGLLSHIAHLVRPWIRHGQIADPNMLIVTQQVYQFLFILFEGLALVIAHICALKMNAYLRRYIRHIQKKQLKEAKDSNLQLSLSHILLVKSESVSKSSFSPRIPGTGLSIAINSPTFVLSIVLSIFALIGALIAF